MQVWPHNQSGHGLQGMWSTPHFKYQHGSGHWIAQVRDVAAMSGSARRLLSIFSVRTSPNVAQAIRTSPHYTASPDEATVTFVDLNCCEWERVRGAVGMC